MDYMSGWNGGLGGLSNSALPEWVRTVLIMFAGALLTLVGELWKWWWQHRHEKTTLARSFAAELDGLRKRYEQFLGEKKDPSFERGFEEPRFDYFRVFHSNASKLGNLKQDDAEELVRLYIFIKGHFEDVLNWTSWTKQGLPGWSEADKNEFVDHLKNDRKSLLSAVPKLCQRLRNY